MNTYEKLINKHRGEPCFIFGAGPSLWHNMHEPFFKKIKQHGITIAVNSSVMAIPDFDYWISNDALCRRWSWWKSVKDGSGIKIVRNSWGKYKAELEDFLFFSPRNTSEDIIDSTDKGLAYCSSVPSAIDLSIQMGCKNIFLFGVDHNEYKHKHHFWQFMKVDNQPKANPPAQGPWSQQKKVFDINVKAYEALNKFAEEKGSKIYNVGWIYFGKHLTKIKTFEKIEICDIKKILRK